jgi:DNA-binding XRE family transcriptional regulator
VCDVRAKVLKNILLNREPSRYVLGMANNNHEPEAVRYARRRSGLTQTQLAKLVGCGQPLISDIEAGRRNATPEMLIKLAKAMNCPVVVLERKQVSA